MKVRLGWRHRLNLPSKVVSLNKRLGRLYVLCADGSVWRVSAWLGLMIAVQQGQLTPRHWRQAQRRARRRR